MSDILKFLHDYPDDISLVMSKARVLEIIAEIERLQSELAGALEDAEELNVEVEHYANLAIVDLGANPTVSWKDRAEAAEAERDEMRGLIREARPFVHDTIGHPTIDLQLRMDAAIKGFEK